MSAPAPELSPLEKKAKHATEVKTMVAELSKTRKADKKAIAEFKKSVANAPDGAKQVRAMVREVHNAQKNARKAIDAKKKEGHALH